MHAYAMFESHLGQLTFSLKRESELSQVVVLCCLALFNVPHHVHVFIHKMKYRSEKPSVHAMDSYILRAHITTPGPD